MIETALYLIPVNLSDAPLGNVLPDFNATIVAELKFFIVENVRSARRFLKKFIPAINIDELSFSVLNKHTSIDEISQMLDPLIGGHPVGLLSEAGCPAIADPGADIVTIAQSKGLKVKPLVGPSSILLGLMASGFNGQSFCFNGYLPIDKQQRKAKLEQMQHRIRREHQTQIFIETPYRNNSLLDELCRSLAKDLKLCIATDITGENESIVTKTVAQWAKTHATIGKIPTIFLVYK